jgi:hypothetical protein
MSRARRLSEIAKANQPVFESTNGSHWWLADPSAKSDPQPSAPVVPHEQEPVAVSPMGIAVHSATTNGSGAKFLETASHSVIEPVSCVRLEEALQETVVPPPPDLPSRLRGLKQRLLLRRRRAAQL